MENEKGVAPESYKPAEGPELSELIAQQGIKPMKTGHELEIPGLSDEDMEGFPDAAATPVTVEAPGNNPWHLFRRLWTKAVGTDRYIKQEWRDLEAVMVRAKIGQNWATPKPIGDVEAVARQIAGPVLILARGMTYEGFREHIKDILSPFFAPAGPREDITPSSIAKWLRVQEKEIRPWDSNERNEIFRLLMAFAIDHFQAPAQPPCSECATLRKERDEYQEWMNCGGCPNPYKCSDPSEPGHEIFGCAYGQGDGTFLCEIHYIRALISRAEAAEAQLSTLRDALEAIKIALKEPAGGEYWTARKFLDERGIYHGDLDDLRVLNKVAEAALAPTPEVAPVKILRGQRKVSLELEHESETGTHSIGGVAPKEGQL